MSRFRIRLQWSDHGSVARFRTGVSLHSHTLHSRESLGFIYEAAAKIPILAGALRRQERRYKEDHGTPLDLTRGWWTPPLGPHEAWQLERAQIAGMHLNPLVSLTDHGDIEGPVSLQILEECRDVPISFEWTVPCAPTFFHLGIHNLPASEARPMFERMQACTRDPRVDAIADVLSTVHMSPGTLTVFNHPLWDEDKIGAERHQRCALDFIARFGMWIHAIELNGFRPWRENRSVMQFATAIGKPAISGGDRHGLEPNATLNLTNAVTFGEFAAEIRSGWSDVLIMPQYRELFALRVLHNTADVVRTYEQHAKGWRTWSDRVFYECDDLRVRSVTELLGNSMPAAVALSLRLLRAASQPGVRRFLRDALPRGQRVLL